MNRVGAAAVLLSKGTPFMLAGEEMLRTKQGNENSYNASDEINNLDWDALAPDSAQLEMVRYYRELIAIRKANAWIRDGEVEGNVLDGNAIEAIYSLDGAVSGIAVFNPNETEMVYTLPDGAWTALLGGEGTLTGTVTVPARSVLLVRAGA